MLADDVRWLEHATTSQRDQPRASATAIVAACWDPAGVDLAQLDPVLLTFDNQRAAQKAKFKGELFPSSVPADQVGTTFIEVFQVDRFTGAPKGLLLIDLTVDSML